MYRTFLGAKKACVVPCFFIKFLLLGVVTTYFFVDKTPYKLFFLIALMFASVLLLKKSAFKVLRFLLIASFMLIMVWFVFVYFPISHSFLGSFQIMLHDQRFFNALIRLWALFLAGHLFLGVTTRYEVLLSLKRVHASVRVSLFVVILFNAIAYFVALFGEIKFAYYCRVPGEHKPRDKIHILYSLVFDALSLIFECKKAFFLNRERVYASLRSDNSKHVFVSTNACAEKTPRIEIRQVIYPDTEKPVIADATFEIEPGITLIIGKNGAGKTTLFNVISGIIPNIINADYELGDCTDLRTLDIGYVLQGIEISFFYDTVERAIKHLPRKQLVHWLDEFGMTYLLEGEKPISELSAGECKIIALLAELLDPCHDICLLDEPGAFLSEDSILTLLKLLKEIGALKRIVCISHDRELYVVSDRILRLEEGILLPSNEAKAEQNHLLPSGNSPIDSEPFVFISIPQPLLPSMENEKKGWTSTVTVKLFRGETLAICGRNGAGKSTLGKYLQCQISKNSSSLRCVMLLQGVNQQFFSHTVMDELMIGTDGSHETYTRAKSYLEQFELLGLADQPSQFISGGQKRLVLILCMIMQNPDVIILDEPFDSIDKSNQEKLVNFLLDYQQMTSCCYVILDQSVEKYQQIINRTLWVERFRVKTNDGCET